MTVYDETIEAIARDPEIRRLHGALSAGDISILIALLDDDSGVGATMVGSPNAAFWRCLSGHGWMAEMDALLPDLAPVPMQNYRITDRGYRAIPVVLCELTLPDLGS